MMCVIFRDTCIVWIFLDVSQPAWFDCLYICINSFRGLDITAEDPRFGGYLSTRSLGGFAFRYRSAAWETSVRQRRTNARRSLVLRLLIIPTTAEPGVEDLWDYLSKQIPPHLVYLPSLPSS